MEDYLKIYTIDELFEKAQKEHKQQWTQQRKGKLITAHRRKSLPMRSEKTKVVPPGDEYYYPKSGSGWKSWGVKDWFDEVNGRQMSVSAKTLDHLMTDEELEHIGRTWSKDKIEQLSNETEKYLDLPFSAKQQKKFKLKQYMKNEHRRLDRVPSNYRPASSTWSPGFKKEWDAKKKEKEKKQ